MSAFSDGTDHRGGHSRVTQFRNQEDTGGHARSRARRQSSTGGHARNRRDTEGRTVVPVRDREAPGSNPGPPTKSEYDPGVTAGVGMVSDHSRITISRGTAEARGRANSDLCADPPGRIVTYGERSQSAGLRWPHDAGSRVRERSRDRTTDPSAESRPTIGCRPRAFARACRPPLRSGAPCGPTQARRR
jgi:hypothetical protein